MGQARTTGRPVEGSRVGPSGAGRLRSLAAGLARPLRWLFSGALDGHDMTCVAASQWVGGVATRWSTFDWKSKGGDPAAPAPRPPIRTGAGQ